MLLQSPLNAGLSIVKLNALRQELRSYFVGLGVLFVGSQPLSFRDQLIDLLIDRLLARLEYSEHFVQPGKELMDQFSRFTLHVLRADELEQRGQRSGSIEVVVKRFGNSLRKLIDSRFGFKIV